MHRRFLLCRILRAFTPLPLFVSLSSDFSPLLYVLAAGRCFQFGLIIKFLQAHVQIGLLHELRVLADDLTANTFVVFLRDQD